MKRTGFFGIAALAAAGAASLMAASVCAQADTDGARDTAAAYSADALSLVYPLDESSAQELALFDAGADAADAERLRTKPERENGEDVIEVEFYFENNEYEYTIRPEDGMILEWQIEGRDVADAAAELSLTDGTTDAAQQETQAADGAEAQTEAAADGAEAQTEAAADGAAAQTETAAADSAAAQTETAADGAAAQTTGSAGTQTGAAEFVAADGTALVGLEKAKEAVRADAGDADGLTFAKIHFECGRRYYEYEFEVYAGGREYEYTVDAQTGEVLFREMDD